MYFLITCLELNPDPEYQEVRRTGGVAGSWGAVRSGDNCTLDISPPRTSEPSRCKREIIPVITDNIQPSASKSSIRRFVITEKAPTRAFSWLKAATTAFTFKTLLRHYAIGTLTPR